MFSIASHALISLPAVASSSHSAQTYTFFPFVDWPDQGGATGAALVEIYELP